VGAADSICDVAGGRVVEFVDGCEKISLGVNGVAGELPRIGAVSVCHCSCDVGAES